MLTLYHSGSAVCAAKVRLVLAEKNISYESRMLDFTKGEQFSADYRKLNPNAVVPTLVHDGNVLIESTVINEYLDDTFPQHPLRPADPLGRAHVHLWTKREDSIHDAINTMTGVTMFRTDLMQKTPEERRKRYDPIPDPIRREKWRQMVEKGLESQLVNEALSRLAKLFRDMDAALERGPWLCGAAFTLADAGLISFINRLDLLNMGDMWRDHFPRVADWFTRCKARPSFAEGIVRHIPEPMLRKYNDVTAPLWPDVDRAYRSALAAL